MESQWTRLWWALTAVTCLALALGWALVGVGHSQLDGARMLGLTWRGALGLLALRVALAWLFPTAAVPSAFPSPLDHPMRRWHILPAAVAPGLCQRLIEAAEALPWTRERHTVATQDQPLKALGGLADEVQTLLNDVLFPQIAGLYELPVAGIALREGFVVKYDASQQSHLPFHRDASILTLSIALNDRAGYKGGGTHFPCIDHTIQLERAGDTLVHCGKLQHGGRHVQRGRRYLLVCFLDCSGCPDFDHEEIATWDSMTPDDWTVMARIYRG